MNRLLTIQYFKRKNLQLLVCTKRENSKYRCQLVIFFVSLFQYISFNLCFPGSSKLDSYNIKEIERNEAAYDKSNEKLFPHIQRKLHAKKFNSILPPPNITGNLHLGHALMITTLDVLCRWKHLNGYDVQLIPGTDHAGIATQVVVEQQIKKKLGKTRFDIGKSVFVGEVLKWKEEKGEF